MRVVYGVLAYLLFLATMLWAVAFVGGFMPVHVLDSFGPPTTLTEALTVDALLIVVFGVQHSVMARGPWKRWYARHFPEATSRSTYVLASSLCLLLLFWQWRPIPSPAIWHLSGIGAVLIVALGFIGWGIAVLSTFLIDHFELFGLAQVLGKSPDTTFRTPFLYRAVRHPLYLGFVIAFWATPNMTASHLAFAAAMTAYILIAIPLEERDLIRTFGDPYLAYRRRVRALLPF